MGSVTVKRMVGNRAPAFGLLLAALLAMMLLAAKPAYAEKTFTVNSTGDQGDTNTTDDECRTGSAVIGVGELCTLRAAIEQANATEGPDTINFNISGGGIRTISPATSLPDITEPVIIDGYTQPGASPNTLASGNNADLRIRLDGNYPTKTLAGLRILADDSVVRGLSFTSFFTALAILGADDNEIEGNFMGTDPSGTRALGNANTLFIGDGASGNTVGGTTPAARNLISGNNYGVLVTGAGTTGNKIQGNYIGTTKSGTGDLGNQDWGVIIEGSGASGNLVGGASRAAANIIAFNGGVGVAVSGYGSTGNRILSNSIHSNGGLGIDLFDPGPGNPPSGVTPNDPGDADTGPNDLQNFPTLSSAIKSGPTTAVRGTLNSVPNSSFVIQFFASPQPDPSGFGEGQSYLGQRTVTTGASGNASFSFSTSAPTTLGQSITATATGAAGDTSEFSKAILLKKDAVKPTITPLSPKPGSTTARRNVSIQATVRDNVTDLAKANIRLFVDGRRITNFAYDRSTDRLSFTARGLSIGRRTVRITATDAAGNVASRSWSFRVVRR